MVATTIVAVTRSLAVTIARLVTLVTVVARPHRVMIITIATLAATVPRRLARLQSAIRIRLPGTMNVTILMRLRAVTMSPRIRRTGIRPVDRGPRTEAMGGMTMLARVIGDFSSFAFASSGSFLFSALLVGELDRLMMIEYPTRWAPFLFVIPPI